MSEIRNGDHVMTVDPSSGSLQSSEVIMFLHRNQSRRLAYVTLETASGRNVSLTPSHLIYASSSTFHDVAISSAEVMYASSVREGQYVFISKDFIRDSKVVPELVLRVRTTMNRGSFAPVTRSGNLLVNEVAVSCYAVVNSHNIAHVSFAPIRLYYTIKHYFPNLMAYFVTESNITTSSAVTDFDEMDSIHPYAIFLHTIAPYVIDTSYLYGN